VEVAVEAVAEALAQAVSAQAQRAVRTPVLLC